jgi:hypothetical protein
MQKVASDIFLWEVAPIYSRDTVAWTNTAAAPAGTPVKLSSTTGKHLPAAAADGASVAGILFADAKTGDERTVIIARAALVKAAGIVFPAGVTAAQQAAHVAGLAALGIIAR